MGSNMEMKQTKQMVGQHFVAGFAGLKLSEEFVRLIKEYKIGNVILFRQNVKSKEQLTALCEEIQQLVKQETGHPAFITIDQEGGVVTRLSEEFCNTPEGMALSATGKLEDIKTCARITARQLKSCGVNFNLAPVLDVNNNPQNPVIGVRSFGDTPQKVAESTQAVIEGYREENLISCGKHFPGHGDTAVDSHLGLPVVDKTLEELMEFELVPFRSAIDHQIPAMMSSHILFPSIEEKKVPCTMSRTIITDILKKKLGFEGLVVSDCMEMNAIKTYYGSVQGVQGALGAGVDLVCISHSAEVVEQSVQAVYQALKDGTLSIEEMEQSTAKILAYKEKYEIGGGCQLYDDREDKKIEREIRRRTIAHVCGKDPVIGSHPVFIGCDNFCVTQASNPEEDRSFAKFMPAQMGGTGIVTGIDPTEEEIQAALRQIPQNCDSIVLCTYNMHLKPGQQKLLNALTARALPMTVVAMRNPYDLKGLPAGGTGIEAWDYSMETLELLVELFQKKWNPTGVLPIEL